MAYYSDRDIESAARYAEHLRTNVQWQLGTVIAFPKWALERDTLYQVAAEHGFFLKVRQGKATVVPAAG